MQISRGDHLILLLDSSQTRPPFSGAARVYIIDLLDNSPYLASQFQLARNSDDSHTRCPCELATTPENFSYVFGHGVGDTLSAFYADKNLASEPDGDRFGSIVFPDGIGQIVANGNAAYVTDFQGRLHVVAALPGNTLGQHDLQLGNFLTNIVIKGTLIRDASNAAPYFYEFGGGPNHPAGTPSTIKVYNFGLGNPALVATVATTTNSVVKAEFGSREIFFWDNTDLKAMSRNTWQVRTLAGAPLEAAGSRLFFDEVTKIIYFPSNDRDVVFAMDTTTP